MQENINLVASGEGDYRSKVGGKVTSNFIYFYLLSASSVCYMPGTVLLSTVQTLMHFIYFKNTSVQLSCLTRFMCYFHKHKNESKLVHAVKISPRQIISTYIISRGASQVDQW